MSLTAIILLILLGIALLIVEFLIAPGVTIAGIGGLLSIGIAIFYAYYSLGATTGNFVLLGTIASTIAILIIALKSGTWKVAMLNKNINGHVDYGLDDEDIKVGDQGEAITRLNPIGKVRINNKVVEGKSMGGYIDEKTKIEVVKILSTNVLVKPIN
jgi:membrane-bound ClpP family serine protease